MKESDHDELAAKLRAWRVEPQVPVSFQRQVWQRIAVRQTAREGAFWPSLARSMFAQFARPQYALAILLVSLSASVGFAHLHAQEANARHWKALEIRYARSVDPLSMGR